MNKIFKHKYFKKINLKVILLLIVIILLLPLWKYWYEYYKYDMWIISVEEQENRKIDEYNFEQLEKVKNILKSIKRDDKKFSNLKEFNKQYKTNIKPIKNCYYMSNSNWNEAYIFWFELYSNKFINKYWTENYVYPKYDLPKDKVCVWKCIDVNFIKYIKILTNPCKD
jgi:hypothetical protein